VPEFPPAATGTELRLDAILAELRALRAERRPPEPPAGAVELREPARPRPRRV
jgi:hypothetical protein